MDGEITENNMSDGYNLAQTGTLPPELYQQQQELNRQQQMAAMLMQNTKAPQGQMISGHYVAPSFLQNLVPLANMYVGSKLAERGDAKALELAKALKTQYSDELHQFNELLAKNPADAYSYASQAYNPKLQDIGMKKMLPEEITLSEGQKRFVTMPDGTVKEIASGGNKFHAPLQIDTGTAIELRDPYDPTKVLSRLPKSQMPTAGQVVETANGPMLIDTRTGQGKPIMGPGNQPLAPKLTAEQNKDITSINQQSSTIEGALKAVKESPGAFTFGRGMAQGMPAGESIAGRFDTPENAQARAYVFNNVSAVIKERAGTAQSAQELQRINSFMPAVTDNAKQIENKLSGFKLYLKDLEAGTRVNPNIPMQSQSTQVSQAPQIDPKLLQYMTPEQQALFRPKGQ
jgi:hypothetical protein